MGVLQMSQTSHEPSPSHSISQTGAYAQIIGEPAVVAGNSLGGYASLATAVRYPEAVKGVVLLNAAGRFEEVKAEAQAQVEAALPSTEAGQGAKEALREVCRLCPSLVSVFFAWFFVAQSQRG